MSIIQAIIGTNLTISGGAPPPPPPPPTPDGQYLAEDGAVNWFGVSENKPGYNTNYSFPDNQTVGTIWDFNGANNWMLTQNHIAFNQMYINMWFYPTANGRIILTIQETTTENTAYHHSTLEINSNNTVSAGFWNGVSVTSVTSANTVTLNAWNHVYFRQSSNQILLQVNGGTAVTANNVWGKPGGALYIGVGTISITNMGNSGRFAGYLAEFRMNSTNTASNYDSTRSRYEAPQQFIYDDFTIEWWQKAENISVNTRPWCIGLLNSASGQVVSISYENTPGRDFVWLNDGYPAQQEYRPLKNHYGIGWEHMAIVRKDNVINVYSNGSNYLTWPNGNQAITAINANLIVGTGEIPNGNFQGWIKDLHIIKGYAKYNGNFSVPTQPIQPQTGSVFLLPAMGAGEAFDDTVGNKFGSYTNTPTWSSDNPYQWPTQTFTAFAYGEKRIALNAPYVNNPIVGLKVSDTQGWSDYVTSVDLAFHLDFDNPVPTRDPGEVYTIEEAAISAFSNVGNGNVIDFGGDNYWKALEIVEPGWTVSTGGPTLATVTSRQDLSSPGLPYIRINVTPNIGAIYGTYTFTPPNYGGSIRFDAGDRIDYGASVDFAFDVDGIASDSLTLNLDANNATSYSGTGSTWSDLSVGNFPYTLVGAPYWDNGPPAYFNFSGVGQYATGPNVNMLPGSAYSKMVWFRLNTLNADNNLVSSDGGGHYMFFSGGNRLYAGHSNVPPYQGVGAFGSVATFTIDTWYCATVTYSEANGIRIYINGVLDNQTAMIPHTGNGSTNIACFGAGGNLLNGKIGRVLCYSKELTAGEVLQNFNATRNRYGI